MIGRKIVKRNNNITMVDDGQNGKHPFVNRTIVKKQEVRNDGHGIFPLIGGKRKSFTPEGHSASSGVPKRIPAHGKRRKRADPVETEILRQTK